MSLATHLIVINGAAPMLLCDKHTKVIKDLFELVKMPYDCVEIVRELEADADTALDPEKCLCQACDLAEVTKPNIILPN